MALVTCPECREPVSSTAEKCPHCGIELHITEEYVRSQNKRKPFGYLVAGLFMLPFLVIWIVLLKTCVPGPG